MSALGRHILVEFHGCAADLLNDVPTIEQAMVAAAKAADATVINSTFHHFSPYGVSGVVVIQESHLAIHTWPEFGYAAVDIFTCGETVNPWLAYDFLKKALLATQGNALEIQRGAIDLLERVAVDLPKNRAEKAATLATPTPKFKREVWFSEKNKDIAFSMRHTGELLHREQSTFQKIEIYDTYAFGKMLALDNLVMCTEKDEFIYHEMIAHVPMLAHPTPQKILVIGGGDGGTVRELLRHEGVEQVIMVEIDERVVAAARQHLPTIATAFDHPKLDLKIGDGIQFLANCPAEEFDLIIVDGSDPEGNARGGFSIDFYKNAHRCLRKNGLLCLQSEGPYFNQPTFLALNQCLNDLFGKAKNHVYFAYMPTYPSGMWSFHLTSKGDIHPLDNLDEERAVNFLNKNTLKYYNLAVHYAAFAVPNFVKNMLMQTVSVLKIDTV